VIRKQGSWPATEKTMGLLGMILGLALFLGVHALTTQRELRALVIASSGEGGYKIAIRLSRPWASC